MSEQNNTAETANTENAETEQIKTPKESRGVKKAIIAGSIAIAVIAVELAR